MPLDPPQPFRMSRNPSKRTDTMIIYNDPMKPFQAYQGYAQWGSKDLTGVMFHLCSYEKQYQLPIISREFIHCWEYKISSLVLEGPFPTCLLPCLGEPALGIILPPTSMVIS